MFVTQQEENDVDPPDDDGSKDYLRVLAEQKLRSFSIGNMGRQRGISKKEQEEISKKFGENIKSLRESQHKKILEFEKQLLGDKEVFLNWLQYNSNINVNNNNSEGVKIMTVHAAKGLQAPIIILADAGDSENMPHENFFWHNEKLIIPNVNEYKNHTIKEIINQRKVKLKQESLRLLYVAMTRAEDELYIFGESGNKKDSWYSIAKTILADNFVKYFELGISDQKHFKDVDLVLENCELPSYFKEDYIVKNIEKKEIASLENQLYSNLSVARGNFIHQILSDASKIPMENFTNYIANLANNSSFNFMGIYLDSI